MSFRHTGWLCQFYHWKTSKTVVQTILHYNFTLLPLGTIYTDDAASLKDETTPRPSYPSSGQMTRARTKALQQKVNSLLTMLDPNLPFE
jgi:hypothetical protein